MDFDLSDEQRMLQESARRFVTDRYDQTMRRRSVESVGGFSPELWTEFAAMGWLGISIPEDLGGIGSGPVEHMILMEELGRGLVVEPYLASVVMAGGLLARTNDPAKILPRLIAGEVQLAAALAEPQGRFDLHDLATRAVRHGDGWRIDGSKAVVLNAPNAEWLVVSARTAGGQRDRSGLSLFLIPRAATGLDIRPTRTQDDFPAGEVKLTGRDGRAGGSSRSRGRGIACNRSHCRRGPHGRRGLRAGLHGGLARDDGGVSEDPQTVRQAPRYLPGAAASPGSDARRTGGSSLPGHRRHAGPGRAFGRTAGAGRILGQGAR
jgi:alkylation response protein AidB-like acyl-CoA dehydrogenase